MAKWIEEIPQWIELYPDWVENLDTTTPQWLECGWAEFNPHWIDGPVCPAIPDVSTLGGAGDYFTGKTPWQREQEKLNKKIKEDDDLCLQTILQCFILIQRTVI